MKRLAIIIVLLFLSVNAQTKKLEIGIEEQLGKKIPLNTSFTDENGKKVVLSELFKTPTVLTFVYYDCPGICTPLMNALAEAVSETKLTAGEDYNIVSISMNEDETPALARDKKNNYMKMLKKDGFPEESWKFLTGDSASIRKVSDAAGFYFKREGDEFIHSGTLIFITKDGMISRYLFPNFSERSGYRVLPFDFKMALTETAEGKQVPTVARMLQFCFSYDPEGKTYVLNFTRVFGAGILLAAVIFVVIISKKPKKKVTGKNEVKE